MTSATETAIAALKTALDTIAADDKPLPAILRNEDLTTRLQENPSGIFRLANLWDGEQTERTETMGADILGGGYEIEHEADLELAFVCSNADTLRNALDAAMIAIVNLLRADPTLGGAVEYVAIGSPKGAGAGLATDGIPHAKGILIPIKLSFVSSLPF